MSQTVRIRTEKPPVLRGSRRRYAKATTTTPFPGFIPGASFDAAAPSRRETLQQFHRLEMMVEVDERLRAENGLVLSDTGGVSDDGYPTCEDTAAGKPGRESAAAAALHDAREELAGRTLHADPYCMENVWSEAQRECQLGEGHSFGEDADMFFFRQGNCIEEGNALEADTHAAIMEDLEKLHSRLQQAQCRRIRHLAPRQRRHASPLGAHAEAASLTSEDSICSSEGMEFDPERYVAPLLRHSDVVEGADLWTPQFGNKGGDVAFLRTVHDILPDTTSVREALQLLQFSVHSNRPDVAACVRRCQQQQRQHQPMTAITNLPTEEAAEPKRQQQKKTVTTGTCGRVEEEATAASRVSRPVSPPSAASLAGMVAKTLPRIPDELRDELMDQRRLLERLAAAQEASFRQLAREQQEAARRRIMAPRADPTLEPLAPSKLQQAEPFEIAEALQKLQYDPKRPLPPVITISTMRPKTPLMVPPAPPSLPPHYIEEELGRLHSEYEQLLRNERQAWANIMQEQKEAFEREKNATIQTLRYAVVQQQHENTEEIKRAMISQELKRRRWQHAAEFKQQMALQQMLRKALPSGNDRRGRVRGENLEVAATTMSNERQPYPRRPQPLTNVSGGGKNLSAKRPVSWAEEDGVEDTTKTFENEVDETKKKKQKEDLRHSIVTGPFSVVLPEEPCSEATAIAHGASSQRVDAVVMMSDNEEKNTRQQPSGDVKAGPRASSDKRRTSIHSSAGKRGKFAQPRRSPYAVPSGRPVGPGVTTSGKSAAAVQRPRVSSKSRNAKLQSRPYDKGLHDGSQYAFAVHGALSNTEQQFYNTTETVLTDSVHSLNATLPPSSLTPVVGGFSHSYENVPSSGESPVGKAMFPGNILLLSDSLTAEEAERRRDVERAFDISLSIPPQITAEGGGKEIQRPCDVYFFGEEASALSPRRRARLRAAEARTRIEARRRLERIKALSLRSPGQKLGEPRSSISDKLFPAEESGPCLADLLASETIHSIIGDAAEASLFAVLLNELEDYLVSAELHRLTSKNLGREDEATRRLQPKEKENEEEGEVNAAEMLTVERVAAALHTFGAPIHEEYSLEGTVLRLLEESLLQSLLRPKSEETRKESTEGEAGEREVTAIIPEGEQTELKSDTLCEVEGPPLWVREVVSVTTDPLWQTPEGEVNPPCEPPVQATTLTTISGDHHPSLPSPPSIKATTTQLPLIAALQKNVVLALEGASGSVVPDATGTVRIVLDINPVMEHLAAVKLPAAMELASPAQGDTIASEARRMRCATEEDLLSCEVVDAPITRSTTHMFSATKGLGNEEVQEVKPPRLDFSISHGGLPLPEPAKLDTANIPQLLSFPEGSVTVTEVTNAQQPQCIEREQRRERARLSDDESLQRQMLEEQEDALRSSWHMMWDWQQMNVAMLNQHRDAQNPCGVVSQDVAAAVVPGTEVEAVVDGDRPRDKVVLPPVPSTSTIRDPITRFILEWMHEYDEKKEEQPAQRSFLDLLHEASHMAGEKALQEGSEGTSMTEVDARRRLLLEIDGAESSSWLSSTHPSSIVSDGLLRFVTRSQHNMPRPRRTCRRSDENSSSATTETTRYTNSSSRLWLAQESWSPGNSLPPTFPTAAVRNSTKTTVTTSSSSRTWPSTSSSEKPHLRDTMLRHLRQIRSSDTYQPEEQEGQECEYSSVEELWREVERIQSTQQKTAQ
ncbi:hypothetical protein TraAM80_04807 [Trypanosoma rangeli]|uniref:Uncharacterized protein n=1 Tax=Trypanosoma rangeli TaxID=5698 RepID=A0A3R7NDT1_TRYRA|nr:uncharacterized protein TraAM80_04807 [Trypanosoma rangeli]RNF04954.1 hypothetical protein TraAM80_04807 [Trypanosoma rangeli]|eukprot:RNF04954.1 hypothetical protein TraAM80_04807 [Trypanosoma rangeli]